MKLSLTHVKILCLGFSAAFILGCPSAPTQPALNVQGQWQWTSTFSVLVPATGCPMSGTKVDTLTLSDDGSGRVTLSGFLGQSANALDGTVSAGTFGSLEEVHFHGTYSQNSGTTTIDTASVFSLETKTTISGEEIWSWTNSGVTCSGRAEISAAKL